MQQAGAAAYVLSSCSLMAGRKTQHMGYCWAVLQPLLAVVPSVAGALLLQLMRHIQSLGILLSTVRSAAAAQNQQVELLRRESLAGMMNPAGWCTLEGCHYRSPADACSWNHAAAGWFQLQNRPEMLIPVGTAIIIVALVK